MKEIVVDGVVYVPKSQPSRDWKICVLDRGFSYIGRVEIVGDMLKIHDARCLIRWGTAKHLGELTNGPLAATKLGATCNVEAPITALVHMIEVKEEKWIL